jgi:RPA family protein
MSIQKKSLISTLKTTKKANVASAPSAESFAKAQTVSPKRLTVKRAMVVGTKRAAKRAAKRNAL